MILESASTASSIWPTLLTVAGTVLVAGLTTWATISVNKSKTRTDVQGQLNSGFQGLIDALQEERKLMSDRLKSQEDTIAAQGSEIRQLRQKVDSMERIIKRHGIDLSTFTAD